MTGETPFYCCNCGAEAHRYVAMRWTLCSASAAASAGPSPLRLWGVLLLL